MGGGAASAYNGLYSIGGGGVLAKMVAFTDSGIKRILHHLEPGQGYKSKL